MKPIPVSFHIGPLVVHTYGIGLAITFWFAYRYFDRRLAKAGYETKWLTGVFLWVVVAAIVGARTVHVLSDISYYSAHPGQILQVWHGGLSSFGGLLFAMPVGLILARKRCPELSTLTALDLVSPVLMAAWGIGRLLGPQLMVAGGGGPTTAWYGMYYSGQQGKRVPVPIIQAIDCFIIFGILILIERRFRDRPAGFIVAATAALWGLARFYEEFVFLRQSSPQGSTAVEVTGLALFAGGVLAMTVLWRRHTRDRAAQAAATVGGDDTDPSRDRAKEDRAATTVPSGGEGAAEKSDDTSAEPVSGSAQALSSARQEEL